jgi:ribonucleoside-diphosphate reductase alpha chain
MIQRLKAADPELELMLRKGRRNIALLTAAPTGTVSLMTQTTSGIEPVFLPVYKRNRKVNPNDKGIRVDFVDEVGDSWETYYVFHHKFIEWLTVKGYNIEDVKMMSDDDIQKIVKISPYYKATSADVDWVEKVRLQGRIQKWVDHSISVTVNLPENISEDMVAKVYEEGWKSGCKGITVYREGSRTGVMTSIKDKKKEETPTIKENHAPKRPKNVTSDVVHFTNKGEKWIAFVGLLDGRPYEIFTGNYESFPVPKYVEKGINRKVKDEEGNKRYDFIYSDKDGYEQEMKGLSRVFNREYWNINKMISAVLRNGMPLPYVISLIDSLSLDGDTIGTWKAGIKRAIKRYIKDGTKVGNVCSQCGQDTLVYQDGCMQCMNPECGFSKCGS